MCKHDRFYEITQPLELKVQSAPEKVFFRFGLKIEEF